MKMLGIDIETYSDVDIREAGAYAYADSYNFEVLLIAYKYSDEEEVKVIDLTGDYNENEYNRLVSDLTNPNILKTAFNANFERTCLAKHTGVAMPPEQWKCTAVLSSTLGLPRSLGDVCKALGLDEDKQKDKIGKQLIQYFCKPCKPTKTNGGRTRNLPEHAPDKWAQFVKYNRQDVVAEQAILERISKYVDQTEFEEKLWAFDQKMNDNGVLIDMDLVNNIVEHDDVTTARLTAEAKSLTELENPNSLVQLKEWIKERTSVEVTSLTKDSMKSVIEQIENADITQVEKNRVLRVLEIRQALGKTSTSKYRAMQKAVCKDNRLRGVLQFYGANRTGRWAGRIVQVHNLPQNKIYDIDDARGFAADGDFDSLELLYGESAFVFSQLIRTAFIASPGNRFVVSDFSAIEARVIAWLADEKWRLDVFNTHGKIYEASASQMFHVPIENIKKGSKLRQQGKIAELALGYGGGFGAIKAMDKDGSIPDEEIPALVSNWRSANPAIVGLWKKFESAAKTAIIERRRVVVHNIAFIYLGGTLFIELPSKRKLAYYDARVEEHVGTHKRGKMITYAGVEQTTKRWGRLETYGGKLTENIVQAVARDCLAVAMLRVDALGYNIVMHVHDEMIVDVPKTDESALDRVNAEMARPIDWAPGLPLKGDGYETVFYKKD